MIRSFTILAVGFCFASGVAGHAHSQPAPTPTPVSEAVTPNADSEKKICRRFAKTGTRIGTQRVCRTAAEWDAYERQTREDASTMTQMKGHTNAGTQ